MNVKPIWPAVQKSQKMRNATVWASEHIILKSLFAKLQHLWAVKQTVHLWRLHKFQRFTLSNHRGCSALLLLKVTDSMQSKTWKERETGRFLWGHATSQLFIWTVCPQSAADGTKRAVKNEAWSCDLWHPNAESRCSSTSSASAFHLTHLHSSVECPCCSSETVLWQKSLFCHDIHSWQNLQKTKEFEKHCSLHASKLFKAQLFFFFSGGVLAGSTAAAFLLLMGADGAPTVWLWGEEMPRRLMHLPLMHAAS